MWLSRGQSASRRRRVPPINHHAHSIRIVLQELGLREPGDLFPEGVFTLEDIKDYGREHGICPYFALRRMVRSRSLLSVIRKTEVTHLRFVDAQMPFVDVIIYSFHYLLDPKVADQVSKELSKESIVVFDEAHNIGRSLDQPPVRLIPRTDSFALQITSASSPSPST